MVAPESALLRSLKRGEQAMESRMLPDSGAQQDAADLGEDLQETNGSGRRVPSVTATSFRVSSSLHFHSGSVRPGDLQQRLDQIDARAKFTEVVQRQRAANMLLVGSVSGLLGFVFAFVIGIIKEQTEGKIDINGHRFESGRGYFPSTVSEMVHNPNQPCGKIFFAFCFVGAVMIFFSWYPTQMRNVYIGDDAQICGISWVTLRQFVPAPGMMMLAIITTVPAAEASLTDQFCIGLHLVGAAMMFVGYFVCEAFTVGWGPFKGCLQAGKLQDTRTSKNQRRWLLSGIGFFYSLFCILQVVLTLNVDPQHNDQWGKIPGRRGMHLLNTATWRVKWLKVASYASEVVCGVLLIGSHLVIWYHSEERHYDLPEELAALHSSRNILEDGKPEEDSEEESDSAEEQSED